MLVENLKSIYVMKAGNKYKIGVSSKPKSREYALKLGNPDLCLLFESHLFSNPYKVENILHNMFKEDSIDREWFAIKGKEKDFIYIVEKVCDEYGCRNTIESENAIEILVKHNGNVYKLDEYIKKINEEILQTEKENEEIQKYTYSLQGYYIPNIYTDVVYESVFGEKTTQLLERYGITKKDNLRDCFSEDELKRIQNAEMLVSSLIGYGWGYNEIKDFVANQSKKLITS